MFESIEDSDAHYSTQHYRNLIAVSSKKIGSMDCFKLNMGVPILSKSSEPEEKIVSFSVCFPTSQDTKKVFLGWCTPEMIYSEDVWNQNITNFNYLSKVEVLIRKERYTSHDDEWRLDSEYSTAFAVRLSELAGDNLPVEKDDKNIK